MYVQLTISRQKPELLETMREFTSFTSIFYGRWVYVRIMKPKHAFAMFMRPLRNWIGVAVSRKKL